MIFLDNISKNISNRMFRDDLGAYTCCQWTGRAIHPLIQEPEYECPSGEVKELSGNSAYTAVIEEMEKAQIKQVEKQSILEVKYKPQKVSPSKTC